MADRKEAQRICAATLIAVSLIKSQTFYSLGFLKGTVHPIKEIQSSATHTRDDEFLVNKTFLELHSKTAAPYSSYGIIRVPQWML